YEWIFNDLAAVLLNNIKERCVNRRLGQNGIAWFCQGLRGDRCTGHNARTERWPIWCARPRVAPARRMDHGVVAPPSRERLAAGADGEILVWTVIGPGTALVFAPMATFFWRRTPHLERGYDVGRRGSVVAGFVVVLVIVLVHGFVGVELGG